MNKTGNHEIIRAKSSFKAKTPLELSFHENQLLELRHKIDKNWFFAYDPSAGKEGYVPSNFFWKNNGSSSNNSNNRKRSVDDQQTISGSNSRRSSILSRISTQPDKGVVLHDFSPLDKMEMNAKSGDKIIILDDSDPDWFLAVHDGRLIAKPQIIPKSYIRIVSSAEPSSSISTSTSSSIDQDDLNSVTATTEQSSVETQTPLTPIFEFYGNMSGISLNGSAMRHHEASSEDTDNNTRQTAVVKTLDRTLVMGEEEIPEAAPLDELKARVVGFFKDISQDEWIFVLSLRRSDQGDSEVLYRTYEDFYLMQFALVRDFPGDRITGKSVIPPLPEQSGPNDLMTPSLQEERRSQFDVYIQDLCDLPSLIVSHKEVIRFFAFRPGYDGLTDRNEKILRKKAEEYMPEWMQRGGVACVKMRKDSDEIEMPSGVIGTKKAKVMLGDDMTALKLSTEEGLESFQLKILKKFHSLTFADIEIIYCRAENGGWIPISNTDDFKHVMSLSRKRNIYFKLSPISHVNLLRQSK